MALFVSPFHYSHHSCKGTRLHTLSNCYYKVGKKVGIALMSTLSILDLETEKRGFWSSARYAYIIQSTIPLDLQEYKCAMCTELLYFVSLVCPGLGDAATVYCVLLLDLSSFQKLWNPYPTP